MGRVVITLNKVTRKDLSLEVSFSSCLLKRRGQLYKDLRKCLMSVGHAGAMALRQDETWPIHEPSRRLCN